MGDASAGDGLSQWAVSQEVTGENRAPNADKGYLRHSSPRYEDNNTFTWRVLPEAQYELPPLQPVATFADPLRYSPSRRAEHPV